MRTEKERAKFRQMMDAAEEVFAQDNITDPRIFYDKLNKACIAREMAGLDFGNSWRRHVTIVQDYYNNNNGTFKYDETMRFADIQRMLDSNYCTSVSIGVSSSQQKIINRKRSRTDAPLPTVESKRAKPTKRVCFAVSDDSERSGYESPALAPQRAKGSPKPAPATRRTRTSAPLKPKNAKNTLPRTRTSASVKLNTAANDTEARKIATTKDSVTPERPKKLVGRPRSRTTVPHTKGRKENVSDTRPNNFLNIVRSSSQAGQRRSDQFSRNNIGSAGLSCSQLPQLSNDIIKPRETSRTHKVEAKKNVAEESAAVVDTVSHIQDDETEMDSSDDSGFVPERSSSIESSDISAAALSGVIVKEKGYVDFAEVINNVLQGLEPVSETPVLPSNDPSTSRSNTVAQNDENKAATTATEQQQRQENDQENNMAQIVGDLHNISLSEDDDANATLKLFSTLQRQASSSSTNKGIRQLETFQDEAQQQIMGRYAAAQRQPQNPSTSEYLELFRNQIAVLQNVFAQQFHFLTNQNNNS